VPGPGPSLPAGDHGDAGLTGWAANTGSGSRYRWGRRPPDPDRSPTRENGRMRIWDVPPRQLCRQHLLGEHRELHGLWNILVVHGGTGGYSHHPETRRWVGKTRALYERHRQLVDEMERRGYQHRSPLDRAAATGGRVQRTFIDPPEEQLRLLAGKPCDCPRDEP